MRQNIRHARECQDYIKHNSIICKCTLYRVNCHVRFKSHYTTNSIIKCACRWKNIYCEIYIYITYNIKQSRFPYIFINPEVWISVIQIHFILQVGHTKTENQSHKIDHNGHSACLQGERLQNKSTCRTPNVKSGKKKNQIHFNVYSKWL